ncbi:STT3 subunit of the oligosaccharyltransferase complex B [Fasciolopsis buskii]|uniref:Dolichyl-diphosphooligosaccharide--protein glycosyltransferase subunit STT3A n=1 Tax=Fasciolopsis buskii TaxID=27845 RepID=A0A8E0VI79_9TREM|nr:STT3 subunit of the oligosaccharyltransferase complex B [Fasciolopsis buski]
MKVPIRLDAGKQTSLIELSVLFLSVVMAFSIRLFAVIRYESIIHEFDPYFNYRTTRFMTEKGFYDFHDWFDDMAWYPLGRIIGGTIYPGLMVTSSLIFHLLDLLHITIDIRDICVFLAPLFSSFTTIITFLLTKEVWDTKAGLLASALIAVVPGYISRSVAGSYDNEGIAIFCMLFTFYLWVKSVKTGSVLWAQVSSWGGYVFLINVIPIHVLILMITGRFSHRLYVAYSTVYTLGTILSMQISFVGFLPVISSEHMGALGVFGLIQMYAFYEYLRMRLSSSQFYQLLRILVASIGAVLLIAGTALAISGKIAPWTGRFYSLLDPTYAKNHIPIIASVSEHQPTAWSGYYFDLQMLAVMFPVGLYYCFKKPTDASIFLITYGILSLYFSGVMVRLILVLAPIMCILGSIGVSGVLSTFMANIDNEESHKVVSKSTGIASSGSHKTPKATADPTYPFKSEDARIMSWWDYGYQITGIANRTVLVDNNTWNNTHIGRVGQAMASSEEEAYEIMQELDVDYVLVIFGGLLGYSSDDINKFIWMVRIAGSTEKGRHIREEDYYTPYGEMRVDKSASPTMQNCLMYKLSYYRFWHLQPDRNQPSGFDRVRRQAIGNRGYKLTGLEEAFTSENWLVRIYRVKPPANRGVL